MLTKVGGAQAITKLRVNIIILMISPLASKGFSTRGGGGLQPFLQICFVNIFFSSIAGGITRPEVRSPLSYFG